MSYRRRIERRPLCSPEKIQFNLSETIQKLQNPGVVVAFKEDICALKPEHEVFIVPHAHEIPFSVELSSEVVDICKSAGTHPSIHLSSKFAQAGFDLDDLSHNIEDRSITGKLANVGPRSFRVPTGYEVPFGFLYTKSRGLQDETSVDHHITQFKKVNSNDNYFRKIKHPDTLENSSHAMFIEMDRLLHFEHILSAHSHDDRHMINIAELHRGTERDLLHKQLRISPVNEKSHPDPQGKEYYSLMESSSPINYPKDSGIVIIGGAFINADGTVEQFFDHGDSVIGQHRDHAKNKKDPSHTLIGEFYMPFQAIQDAKKRGLRVGLVCEPVTLYWATQQGVIVHS